MGWEVLEIDQLLDGTDVLNEAVQRSLEADVTGGSFGAVHMGIPCDSFSVALAADGHDAVLLRSWCEPDGRTDLCGANLTKLRRHNAIVRFSFHLAALQLSSGGELPSRTHQTGRAGRDHTLQPTGQIGRTRRQSGPPAGPSGSSGEPPRSVTLSPSASSPSAHSAPTCTTLPLGPGSSRSTQHSGARRERLAV